MRKRATVIKENCPDVENDRRADVSRGGQLPTPLVPHMPEVSYQLA